MNDCVSEFDSCSEDISGSVSRLLDEIADRCRLLNERIRAGRRAVTSKLDSKYHEFRKK